MAVAVVACGCWGCVIVSERLVEWARGVGWVAGPEPDRAVLVCLAGAADDSGHGWVTRAQLEEAAAPYRRRARAFLGRLERRGFVDVRELADGRIEFRLSTVRRARVAYDRGPVPDRSVEL